MILGIGVDVVDVARFERQVSETPALIERLFVPSERVESTASLAGRFAAKEALIKAMGGPCGSWHDVWVERQDSGQPLLRFSGAVLDGLQARGLTSSHLSLSHDGGIATAFVVLEAQR
ncbi:MAG: holo-ACP synthase [Agromyces sp.]